jgi:uncharacterized protein YbjT (DUF2867 family)
MNEVLVTGGTGNLGKCVVDYLLKKNYAVRVLSSKDNIPPQQNVLLLKADLASNTGLDGATAKADFIIHCASNPKNFKRVDLDGTRNLLQSIDRERTRHLVYISIVGVDKSTYPYYQAKKAVEKMIEDSGIPFTILRTTQFHSFILSILESFVNNQSNSVVKIPAGMKFQSVDIKEVAKLLVDSLGRAAGHLPDFGGPQVLSFESMVQTYLNITKTDLEVQAAQIEGERFDLFRSGVNLCFNNAHGKVTWQRFLEEMVYVGTKS